MPPRILIVDDEKTSIMLLTKILSDEFEVKAVPDGLEALSTIEEYKPSVVFLDIMMPNMNGLEALKHIKSDHPGTQVIMLTGSTEIQHAVEAMKLGAFDYLTKPIEMKPVKTAVRNALSISDLQNQVSDLKKEVKQHEIFRSIVGNSEPLKRVFKQVINVITKDVNVLVLGESGTGKELLANAIHRGSHRAKGPFVTVNCSAISSQLADSLLFGHRKGAFTGADTDHVGFFEEANNGTIFLDEVGDMDIEIQAKILRCIEEKKIRRVGEKKERAVDFRIISATNRDLSSDIEENLFRRDLYFRLEEFPVYLPPLRERGEDIDKLSQYFIDEFCGLFDIGALSLSEQAHTQLHEHPWTGNIRELKNVIRRTVVQCDSSVIQEIALSPGTKKIDTEQVAAAIEAPSVPTAAESTEGPVDSSLHSLAEVERLEIEKTLKHTDGNIEKSAEMLGISRATLYRKLREYGIAKK